MKKYLRTFLLASLAVMTAILVPCHLTAQVQVQRSDSLMRQNHITTRSPEIQNRMMSSPLPVSIRQQGRQIRVDSRYNQILPVYTENGTFYSAFRLSKGTNWITGLPKGSYLINNRKFTIY